jgi:CD209 antigen
MAWPDARRYCLDRSYDLVVIESMEEDAFVWAESGRLHGFDSWLGLEDMETNGEYYWVDGTPCWREDMLVGPFHSFRGGMPEDLESQACVEQDIDSGGQWADAECEQVQPFVCEATLR